LDEPLLEGLHSSVLRICDLTGLGQEEGLGRLMVELAGRYHTQAGRYSPALRLARLLVDAPVTPAWAHMLQTVVYSLLVEMGSSSRSNNSTKEEEEDEMADLTDCLGRLAAQSLTYCEDPALPDGLELANWQALSGYIHQESHSVKAFKTSAAAAGGEERDVYEEWRFSPMYRDRGLPLERSTLLPQLATCLSCQLPLVAADARTARPPLPFLPRNASCLVEVLDLDVTCPDLETAVIFSSAFHGQRYFY
jgi:hypothetical protein